MAQDSYLSDCKKKIEKILKDGCVVAENVKMSELPAQNAEGGYFAHPLKLSKFLSDMTLGTQQHLNVKSEYV